MTDGRTIAVVVPTFNRADLLPATIETILAQTRRADEIIVVDDGSQDDTTQVLQRYSGRVIAMRQENAGDLAARNVGLRRATSDLVAFCDSDDLWQPNFLECMAKFWQIEPRTNAAYSNFKIVVNDEWLKFGKFDDAPDGYFSDLRIIDDDLGIFDFPVVERVVDFQPFFVSCMIASREFFLGVGGWDEMMTPFVGRDMGTVLRVVAHPPIGVATKPLVGIRKHGGNLSGDVLKMNLGDADVLETAARTRPELAPHLAKIAESVRARRHAALDIAFSRMDFHAVSKIAHLIGGTQQSTRTRTKIAVASLPGPMARLAATILLRLGSARADARK